MAMPFKTCGEEQWVRPWPALPSFPSRLSHCLCPPKEGQGVLPFYCLRTSSLQPNCPGTPRRRTSPESTASTRRQAAPAASCAQLKVLGQM